MVGRHPGAEYTTRVFDHLLQHALYGFCGGLRNRLGSLRWRIGFQDGQRHDTAIVGQRGIGVHQLQRGDRQTVAVGQGRGFCFAPLTVVRQIANALARETQASVLAQPDSLHRTENRFAADVEGHLAHTDVTGVDQDPGQIEDRALGFGNVTNGVFADLQRAWVNLDFVGRFPATTVQSGGHGDRLHGRAGLEHVDDGAVTHRRRHHGATVVGVVGRRVDHGQYFASLHVHDHQAASLGVVFLYGVAQLAGGQVLQAQINRQSQGLPGLGVFCNLDILDKSSAPILDDLSLARHTGQPVVIRQFDPFTTVVVQVGEADHVRSDIARRVETPELFDAIDAWDFQVEHDLTLLRRQAANQVDEFFTGLSLQTVAEQFCVLAQSGGKRRPFFFGQLHFFRVGPQRRHGRTDRQRLAVAVGDQATVSRDRDVPYAASIALTFQEVMVNHLQIDDAPADRAHHDPKQPHHHAKAPGIEGALELHHGATIRTSAALGIRIFSCSLASVSIRLWAVQVLCSRIRRPHSACALSRTLSSEYRELSNCRFQCAL